MNPCFEIHRLQRRLEIGCAPDEHGVQQAVQIDIGLQLQPQLLFAGEMQLPPYDYSRAVQAVDEAIASRPRFILQETLCVAVAARILADPQVEAVALSITKTERYAGCDGIGVRATLTRQDLAALAPRYAEDPALARWLAPGR